MPRLVSLLVPCLLLSGCFDAEGVEVPQGQIYFPVGLALDQESEHLFVVSSDFDLQYNGGAIQSYALNALGSKLPTICTPGEPCGEGDEQVCGNDGLCGADPCVDVGLVDRPHEQQLLYPGRCSPIDTELDGLRRDSVKVGAFATDAVIRPRLGDTSPRRQRLFVPVRGDSTLHWLDVEDGKLECGQDSDGGCDGLHRAGDNAPQENTRGLQLATEPFAIDANQDGSTIVVTNQTTGTASLFVTEQADPAAGPQLRFALTSDRIPSRPVGIVNLPRTPADELSPTPDAFLMTFRNSAQVRLVRFASDGESTPEREYLVDNGGVAIDANSVGSDSRGIAIDDAARRTATERCDGDEACKEQAALTPIDVYVANRTPASLLIGRTRPPLEYPYFFQSLPLTVGPSRVVVGSIATPSGELETRVFVVCFDSRRVFVYDPKRERFEAEIATGRGPHAIAIDSKRSLLYVGHFTDSFVGVFSLDLAHPTTYGSMLGTLGTPKSPRSSK